ncbi:MAG: hypothetical protein F4W90_07865, partial [Gammaproteobacteria bacterium]|nr:hypothetical protein [Gammaproteobacteria bacterium]
YMAIRLIECQRVLKPTGSIYLHCDPTMSHYLKTTMDCIFGEDQFRNEIVWERTKSVGKGSQHASRTFGSNSDSILFYSVSSASKLDANRALTTEELERKFPKIDKNGRRYNTLTPLWRSKSMGARPNLCYEYNGWRNPHPSGWRISRARLEEMDNRGEIIWRGSDRPLRKTFADTYHGTRYGNVWGDINPARKNTEATGYPTQKPLALLERIIKASSNEGDIVLDPFCGCATTCIAAERLERQWIGIDVSHKAYDLVRERLDKEVARPDELFGEEVHLTTKLPVRLGESLGETKHVYIISHPNYPGEYKVGIAKNVKARLNAYQTSDPDRAYKLEFSHETHLFRETEKHIHEEFDNKHEWVSGELSEIKREICEFSGDVKPSL